MIAFAVGIWFAPIRFISQGVGSGSVGPGSFCSFSVYFSSKFERVSFWSCSFNDNSAESQFMERVKTSDKIISSNAERILVEYDSPVHEYCSYWNDVDRVLSICSTSLRHVNEFERQFIVRNN